MAYQWCRATHTVPGSGDALCVGHYGHAGVHVDSRGREWEYPSDTVYTGDSGMDIFEAQDDIDRRWE